MNEIYELKETGLAAPLFAGWEETPIYSCLQKVMGKIYVTDLSHPKAAMAHVGCIAFMAGEPDFNLVMNKPKGFVLMIPQNESWSELIESCYPDADKITRYAIKKNTVFDKDYLKQLVNGLPKGYELRKIDGILYDECLKDPVTEDFVSTFASKEDFLALGRGIVVLKDGQIVSGASAYSRYREGIEIEVDTIEEEQRKGLASAACAALILNCLKEGLYPSWDACNMISVRLAEKLGYEMDRSYTSYALYS